MIQHEFHYYHLLLLLFSYLNFSLVSRKSHCIKLKNKQGNVSDRRTNHTDKAKMEDLVLINKHLKKTKAIKKLCSQINKKRLKSFINDNFEHFCLSTKRLDYVYLYIKQNHMTLNINSIMIFVISFIIN